MLVSTPSQLVNPLGNRRRHGFGTGAGGAAAFIGPLDALIADGASLVAAYSTRRLRSAYTGNALRIRGDGTGSPEADIGFTATGDLDTTAVAAAIASGGGSNGYFRTWYDQSGNGRNAGNSTASQQPLYAAGSHSKGTATFDNSNDQLDTASFSQAQTVTVLFVQRTADRTDFVYPFGGIGAFMGGFWSTTVGLYAGASLGGGPIMTNNAWQQLRFTFAGASSKVSLNNGSATTGDGGTTGISGGFRIGNRYDGAWPMNGSISEVLVFAGDPTGLASWSAFYTATQTYFSLT